MSTAEHSPGATYPETGAKSNRNLASAATSSKRFWIQCCPKVWNWPTRPWYDTANIPASVIGPQLEWPNFDFCSGSQFSYSSSALQTSNHSSMMAPWIQNPEFRASFRPSEGVLLPPFHTSYKARCCLSGWTEPCTYAGKPNSKITTFTLPETSERATAAFESDVVCLGRAKSSLIRRIARASTSSATAWTFRIHASKSPHNEPRSYKANLVICCSIFSLKILKLISTLSNVSL